MEKCTKFLVSFRNFSSKIRNWKIHGAIRNTVDHKNSFIHGSFAARRRIALNRYSSGKRVGDQHYAPVYENTLLFSEAVRVWGAERGVPELESVFYPPRPS